MSFKKIIYVRKEKDGDEDYLIAVDNVDDADDGNLAIYELQKFIKKSTETIIIIKKGK